MAARAQMHPQGSARPGAITERRNRHLRLRCISSAVSPFGFLCFDFILIPCPAFQAVSAPAFFLLISHRAVLFIWFAVLRYSVLLVFFFIPLAVRLVLHRSSRTLPRISSSRPCLHLASQNHTSDAVVLYYPGPLCLYRIHLPLCCLSSPSPIAPGPMHELLSRYGLSPLSLVRTHIVELDIRNMRISIVITLVMCDESSRGISDLRWVGWQLIEVRVCAPFEFGACVHAVMRTQSVV